MPRKPAKLPDYFTSEEAEALVTAATSYPVKMVIMLRTGLRVSECLSLRPDDIRLRQDPPIITLWPEVTGNRRRRGSFSLWSWPGTELSSSLSTSEANPYIVTNWPSVQDVPRVRCPRHGLCRIVTSIDESNESWAY